MVEIRKTEIRKEMKKELLLFAEKKALKREKERNLLNQLQQTELFQQAKTVGFTYPLPFEIDVTPIFQASWAEGKKIFLPKTLENREMTFFLYERQTPLVASSFGIMEPISEQSIAKDSLDLLVVPALAVNKHGYRVGFGGGYFDTFLQDFKGKTIGLFFDFQLRSDFESQHFDIPIQKILIH